jgi:hypothetical protein
MPVIMPNPVKENRCGKFEIDQRFLEDEPYIVLKIMAKVVIIETASHYHYKSVGYIGYSNQFEPCKDVREIPLYNVRVNRDGESDTISFEKVVDETNFDKLRKITY